MGVRRWGGPSHQAGVRHPLGPLSARSGGGGGLSARSGVLLAHRDLDSKRIEELREYFDMLDADGNGSIDLHELQAAFQLLDIKVRDNDLIKLLSMESKTSLSLDHTTTAAAAGHNKAPPTVSYPDFVDLMTRVMPTQTQAVSAGGAKMELPLRMMLSAYRRKRILDEFMCDSNARARLAALGQEQVAKEMQKQEERAKQREAEAANGNENAPPPRPKRMSLVCLEGIAAEAEEKGEREKADRASAAALKRKQVIEQTIERRRPWKSSSSARPMRNVLRDPRLVPLRPSLSRGASGQSSVLPHRTPPSSRENASHYGNRRKHLTSAPSPSPVFEEEGEGRSSSLAHHQDTSSNSRLLTPGGAVCFGNRIQWQQQQAAAAAAWQQQQLLLQRQMQSSEHGGGGGGGGGNFKFSSRDAMSSHSLPTLYTGRENSSSQTLLGKGGGGGGGGRRGGPTLHRVHTAAPGRWFESSSSRSIQLARPCSRYKHWRVGASAKEQPWMAEESQDWNSMRSMGKVQLLRKAVHATSNAMAVRLHAMRLVREMP